MRKIIGVWMLGLLALCACEKEDEPGYHELDFVPTDVIVKTKGYYTIDEVFAFINTLGHEVEYIRCSAFTSTLPPDSLNYILNYLNAKPYTNDGIQWFVTGYLHYATQEITIFPKLFDIKNQAHQEDWLQSIDFLHLSEQTGREVDGSVIHFHVPEGQEKEWVERFKKYNFVEWAELNYILDLNPWP